ncbi:MAG: T9SS type A sorting domain-containing protein [Bacteroidia bacterium]|nr:T9SS type A sorting domain-containing protein [Bacteroidia bacterium]
MKRIFTLIFTVLLTYGVMPAQTSGGPDAYGYMWYDSNDAMGPTYNWIDITTLPGAIEVTTLDDDNFVGPFPIGFSFPYYWYTVDQFWIGSNGYIKFDPSGQIASPFPGTMPTPGPPNDVLSIFTADINYSKVGTASTNPAQCFYWTNAAADSCIVSYINAPFWTNGNPSFTGSNTFQIIMTTSDSSVTFQYMTQTGTTQNDDIVVGIENNSGSVGLLHSIDTYPASSYAIHFDAPDSSTFQVNDASLTYAANPTNGGFFLSSNGAGYNMTAEIANTGNQALAPFNVQGRIINAIFQQQVIDNQMSNALTPGQTQSITFAAPFTPTTSEIFTYTATTQLLGDATPTNDQQIIEIISVDTNVVDIELKYENGTQTGDIAWAGGGGGTGMEFVPPFYPLEITELKAYITANTYLAGFSLQILDDDGPGGAPGTVLDSIYVSGPTVLLGAYNPVVLSTPITITDGNFYVGWFMDGDGVAIGSSNIPPISNRSYEILGSSWAPYRSRSTEDFMITVTTQNPFLGVDDIQSNNNIGDVYPNPSSRLVYLDYEFETPMKNLDYKIYDMLGKVVAYSQLSDNLHGTGTIELNVSELPTGTYIVRFDSDNNKFEKKFTVGK